MGYILNKNDYLEFRSEFKEVTSLSGTVASNLGEVWRDLVSKGLKDVIPKVVGFVSRGSNIYILVDDATNEDFHFITWVRNITGEDITSLTYVERFGKGSLPRDIEEVLEELRDVRLAKEKASFQSISEVSYSQEDYGSTMAIPDEGYFLKGGGYSFELAEGVKYTLGASKDEDLVLPEKGVSRHHATVRIIDGVLKIEDNNSTNGVKVNGKSIPKNWEVDVKLGSSVKFATVTLEFADGG